MARRRRRNRGFYNPWEGNSRGHRLAALMRWGFVKRGKVKNRKKSHRKHHKVALRKWKRARVHRVKHRVKHRRKHRKSSKRRRHVKVYRRRHRSLDRRTKSYKRYRAAQYKEAQSFLALTGPHGKYHWGKHRGWIKHRNAPRRYRMARRRYRNPIAVASLGGYDWSKGIVPAASIALSIMMSQVAVGYLQSRQYIAIDSAWKRYGVQLGIGVAGVFALKAMKKNEWANYWGLGSLITIAADLAATYVLPQINSMLAPAAAPATTTATAGVGRMGAFPREVRGVGRSVGAFPGQVQRVSSPYDRNNMQYPY